MRTIKGRWRQMKGDGGVYERLLRHMKGNESKWRQMRTNEGRGSQIEGN